MKIKESYLQRRRFLCGMLGGGAAALGCGVAVPVTQYVGNLQEEPPPPFVKMPEDQWQLPPGKARMARYGSMKILLIRTPKPEAELKIFDANCTHLDCTVGYEEDKNRIVCNCHKGYYDVEGRVTDGPPPKSLPKLHFKEMPDGTLVIALEKENLEKAF